MDASSDFERYIGLVSKLRIDCAKCSGLCCVALYCGKTDGFPEDKAAGKPCKNLSTDSRCAIHPRLAADKMRGCLAYDCFGAGQMVTQLYGHDENWRTGPRDEIFKLFLVVFQLYQMLWYLIQALSACSEGPLASDIEALILENEQVTVQSSRGILSFDVEQYRQNVNQVLKKTIEHMGIHPASGGRGRGFFGTDFKKAKLDGRDFSMTLMIAANLEGCSLQGANFLGADMRDANVRNTDLRACVFLTQMQINSAKGNSNTKIPGSLSRPASWSEYE